MLPLSTILAIYWPGQGYGTEDDDAAGRGVIVRWAPGNTLPQPTVVQVRAREAEAVVVIAALEKERGQADDLLSAKLLLKTLRAIFRALFDLRASLTAPTRQELLEVKAEIDAILNR